MTKQTVKCTLRIKVVFDNSCLSIKCQKIKLTFIKAVFFKKFLNNLSFIDMTL